MAPKFDVSIRNRPSERDRETKKALFYLFFIAQICSLFCMVVGILFFILRFLRVI
jgi:hypothetical protein